MRGTSGPRSPLLRFYRQIFPQFSPDLFAEYPQRDHWRPETPGIDPYNPSSGTRMATSSTSGPVCSPSSLKFRAVGSYAGTIWPRSVDSNHSYRALGPCTGIYHPYVDNMALLSPLVLAL